MNRLSDLMYYQGAQQDNPLMGLLSEALYNNAPQQNPNGLLMLAQATPKAGMQKQIIENDPELYGPRPVAPAVAPGPGNYSTPHNPRATVQTPDGRYVTPEEFEMLQRRLREREQRMKK